MLTLSMLRSWHPGQVASVATGLRSTTETFDDQVIEMRRSFDKALALWWGEGADAADARADREKRAGAHASLAMLTLADVVDRGGQELEGIRRQAVEVADEAAARGYQVGDDGAVTAPPELGAQSPLVSGMSAAEVYAGQLRHLLRTAAEADARVAGEIRDAVQAIHDEARDPTTSALGEGSGATSREVAAYLGGRALPSTAAGMALLWGTLTAADKAALFARYPGLGNRGGIPAAERDLFNRQHLADMKQQTQGRIEALKQERATLAAPGLAYRRSQVSAEIEALEARMAEFEGVEAGLSGEVPPRFLLHVDDGGRGAISVNNPDDASHVATYVPGTTSNLTNIQGGVQHVVDMQKVAVLDGGAPQDTAVVAWYGYNAPADLVAASSPDLAEAGAGRLEDFQSGLSASQVVSAEVTTVIGHSYGTTLVGAAATDAHVLRADNVMLLASPGAMTSHASELSLIDSNGAPIPAEQVGEHIWATKAEHDLVPLAGDRSTVSTVVGGVVGGPNGALLGNVGGELAEVIDPNAGGPLGLDPTKPEFGGGTFTSDPGSINPVDAHSGYWREGSSSLRGMGHLIAGNEEILR